MWRSEENGDYFIVSVPTIHEGAPPSPDLVRASSVRSIRLKALSPSETEFTQTFTMDLKGHFPTAVTNAVVIPSNLHAPVQYQKYLMLVKPASAFDDKGKDAKMLGQLLMDDLLGLSSSDIPAVTSIFFFRSSFLRSLSKEYSFVKVLLDTILVNKIRPPKSCSTALNSFTDDDAKTSGRMLALMLISNPSGAEAVDEWFLNDPAMQELEVKVPLLRPFLNVVAQNLLQRAVWGSAFRSYSGAVISVVDMLSDAVMIRQFYQTGSAAAARATIALIGANLLVDCFATYIQNKKKPRITIFKEILLVLSLCKPGVNAYRVLHHASGEKDPRHTFDPAMESNISRALETVIEAIPSGVIQVVMLLRSKRRTATALVSLSLSILSIANTATSITYDFDTNIPVRKRSAKLCGMIPDVGRGVVYLLMVLVTSFHLAAKLFSMALLASIAPAWLLIWMAADSSLFVLYKFARRDFVHCVPVEGWIKYPWALLLRVLMKFLTDFTGIMVTRNPYGAYCFEGPR